MWTFAHLVKKPMTLTDYTLADDQRLRRVDAFVDEEYALYLKPANISDETAKLLLKHSEARLGSTVLVWYSPYLEPMLVDAFVQVVATARLRKSAVSDFTDLMRGAIASTRDPSKVH